jgi:tetratricopeptide (TPR) repeat protein
LDVASRTTRTKQYAFISLILLLALNGAPPLSYGETDTESQLKRFAEQERWAEIVQQVESGPRRNADVAYYYGIALAQLDRLRDARRALLSGHRLQPNDKRFLIELGGVAFKQKHYAEAARWLRRALKIDPHDSYTNGFLATVYFVQDNLEAALKYWNRIEKPQIEDVSTPAELKIRPALLDRAFLFSPASRLRLHDLVASEKRVAGLGVFSRYNFALSARSDGNFDVNFRAQELSGFGASRWAALLSVFGGAFYGTVYPQYFNVAGNAINLSSLLRWDPQKRRLTVSYSSPLEGNPKYRYSVGVDVRNENWAIFPSFKGPAPLLAALNLRTQTLSGGISAFNSGRWDWSVGGELSDRQYRNLVVGSTLAPPVLLGGYELKQTARLNYEVLRVPDQRFVISSGASEQTARIWSKPSHAFEKLQGSLLARWFPAMAGDDYAIEEQIKIGKTFGQVPFDELSMLGLERDNQLWMRAHIGTRDGRKGSAPLGRNYFLSNWQIDKNVYNSGLFGVKLSPFLDSGKITDSLPSLGSKKWLWDTGVQAEFSVLGVGFTFTYGKDLRSGNNAFYFLARGAAK